MKRTGSKRTSSRILSVISSSLVVAVTLWLLPTPALADKYALLIGVAQYDQGFQELPYDIEDVNDLAKVLVERKIVPKENVILMTTEPALKGTGFFPSKVNILLKLLDLSKKLKAEDTLILYFSGHGFIVPTKDDHEMQYLLTPEARIDDPDTLDTTSLSLDKLIEKLKTFRCREFVTILDACRTGRGDGKAISKGLKIEEFNKIQNIREDASAYVIFSCGSNEEAKVWEDNRHKNSVFTYYLIEGLKGKASRQDNKLTVSDLFSYCEDQVVTWTQTDPIAKSRNYRQNPRSFGGGGTIVLARDFKRNAVNLIFSGTTPGVAVTVLGETYTPEAGKPHELNPSQELPLKTAIRLERFGFKPQIIPATLENLKDFRIEPGAWQPDEKPRVRLNLGPTDTGKLWVVQSNLPYWDVKDGKVSGSADNKTPNVIKTGAGVFDMILSQSDQRIAVQIEGQDPTRQYLKWESNSIYAVDRVGNSVKVAPEPLLKFNITHYHRAEKIYVIPEGADYEITGTDANQVLKLPGDVMCRAYINTKDAYAYAPMGWEDEQKFWQINIEDGKIRRYTITAKRINGKVPEAALEAPDRADDTDATLRLAQVPDDAKVRIAFRGHVVEKNLTNHQVRIEMDAYRVDANLSVVYPGWDASQKVAIALVSGQTVSPAQSDIERLKLKEISVELTSETPGLTIVAINGRPWTEKGTQLKLKPEEAVHLTLTADGSLLKEIDITGRSGMKTIAVEMEPHNISDLPKNAWVKLNPRDQAKMVWIPAGSYVVGGGKSYDKKHELPSGTVEGGYWIYAQPVTLAQYLKFCADTGRKPAQKPTAGDLKSEEQTPVTSVNADDAEAYAAWAGGALQKETEWEYAARVYHLISAENHPREWCQSALTPAPVTRGRKRGNPEQIFTWREEERSTVTAHDLTFRVVVRN